MRDATGGARGLPAPIIGRASSGLEARGERAAPRSRRGRSGRATGISARRFSETACHAPPCRRSSVGSVTPSSAAGRARVARNRGVDLGQQAGLRPLAHVRPGRPRPDEVLESARHGGPVRRADGEPGRAASGSAPELATIRGVGNPQEVRRAPGDAVREPVGREDEVLGQPLSDRGEPGTSRGEGGRDLPGEGRPEPRRGVLSAAPRPRRRRRRAAAPATGPARRAVVRFGGGSGGPAGPRRPPPEPRRTAPR